MSLKQDTKYEHQWVFQCRLNMNHHAETIKFLQNVTDEVEREMGDKEDSAKVALISLVAMAMESGLPSHFGTAEDMLKHHMNQKMSNLEGLVTDGVIEILEALRNIKMVGASYDGINESVDGEYEDAPDDLLDFFADEISGK